MTHFVMNYLVLKKQKRVNFIQCTNLAAKIAPTAVEAPSHLLPAWPASGPDWHSYDSELPTGLWMFVQQTDSHLHLLASEELPPSSVNRTIKHLTVTVRLSHLTLLLSEPWEHWTVSPLSSKPQIHNKDRMLTWICTLIYYIHSQSYYNVRLIYHTTSQSQL